MFDPVLPHNYIKHEKIRRNKLRFFIASVLGAVPLIVFVIPVAIDYELHVLMSYLGFIFVGLGVFEFKMIRIFRRDLIEQRETRDSPATQ